MMNFNQLDFGKTENLLKFSAFILACISAFTTAEGFEILMKELPAFISWSFAIAVSIALVYCSLELSNAFKKGTQAGIITIFILFASLSVFFNFNSIFGRFTRDDKIGDEAKEIYNKILHIQQKSLTRLDSVYGFTKAKNIYTGLKDSLNFEEIRKDRAGQGKKYYEIFNRLPKAKSDSTSAAEKYLPLETRIKTIAEASMKSVSSEGQTITLQSLSKAVEGYNQICTITKAELSNFDCTQEKMKGVSGQPDYALIALVKLFSFDSSLSAKETSSISLSLFISFLLDFPVFIALILLNWRGFKRRKNLPKNIFGDDAAEEPSKNEKGNKTKNTGKFEW
jgi:hypothetical protein